MPYLLLLILFLILYSFYNINCSITVCLIKFLHILLILYILLVPFFIRNKSLLLFYILTVTFIVFHWIVMNDTCALTLLEKYLTEQNPAFCLVSFPAPGQPSAQCL